MEKAYLKALALQNATDKLMSKVTTLQTAINQGASTKEVAEHYSSITFECSCIGQMLADVRRSCFEMASRYYYEWEQ